MEFRSGLSLQSGSWPGVPPHLNFFFPPGGMWGPGPTVRLLGFFRGKALPIFPYNFLPVEQAFCRLQGCRHEA